MTLLVGRIILVALLAVTVLADEPVAEEIVDVKEVPVSVPETADGDVTSETKTKFFGKPSSSDKEYVKHEIIVIPNSNSGGGHSTYNAHHHNYTQHNSSQTNHTHGGHHNHGFPGYPLYYPPYPFPAYYPPPQYYPQYPYIPPVYAPVPSLSPYPYYQQQQQQQQDNYQKPIIFSSGGSGSSGKPDGLWSLIDQKHSELLNLFTNKGGSGSGSDNKIHEVVVINAKPDYSSGYGSGGYGHGSGGYGHGSGGYGHGSGSDYGHGSGSGYGHGSSSSSGSGYGHGHGSSSGYGHGSGSGYGQGSSQGWFIKGKHAHSSDCNE